MNTGRPAEGRYAVLFRTHFWDDFAARQYERLVARSRGGQVFILADETNGTVKIDRDNIVRYTQSDVLALGLAGGGYGNLLWYNGDYSLYAFFARYDQFDYYIMVEYDVAVNRELDDVVATASQNGYDFIGLTTVAKPGLDWNFTDGCLDVYRLEDIRQRLICVAVFSGRAARRLFERRLELSRQYRDGAIRRWPYCEAYIPTELSVSGFKMAELSEFGPTDHYDWRPAFVETDLDAKKGQAFVHPVLDPKRYIAHTLKNTWPPEGFFYPGSDVGRRIRRVAPRIYWLPLAKALRSRIVDIARRRIFRHPAQAKAAAMHMEQPLRR